MSGQGIEALRAMHESRVVNLLPKLVVLTDALEYSDWELNSTLGRKNGKPYEALYQKAVSDVEYNLDESAYSHDIERILKDGRVALEKVKARL